MTVYFCAEFIRDLADHGDANFAARVLGKVVGAAGQFEADADDHRYQGAEGAWIRYISRQQTAYRAIFIRRGEDIFWYRAGGHSIENRLAVPAQLNVAAQVGASPAGLIEEARIAELTPAKSPITVEALDKAGLMDEIV